MDEKYVIILCGKSYPDKNASNNIYVWNLTDMTIKKISINAPFSDKAKAVLMELGRYRT